VEEKNQGMDGFREAMSAKNSSIKLQL